MARQTDNGKAFEYSIAKCYYDFISSKGLQVTLSDSTSLSVAKKAYNSFLPKEQKRFDMAARSTIETLIVLEPGLMTPKGNADILQIRIASDAEGKTGDVRDVIFRRLGSPSWEIGFSAKNNHDAVKHSRLSPTIDFGKEWLGCPCATTYFDAINKVFLQITDLMKANPATTWKDLGDSKAENVYKPILIAFKREMQRLISEEKEVPERLLNYLIGRYPFYKIIKDDANNLVVIKSYNLNGQLGKMLNGVRPNVHTERIHFPTRIIEFDFYENSDNTLIMVLDKGWQISFRIHSAKTLLEASLKFDINLIGNPPMLFTQHLFIG